MAVENATRIHQLVTSAPGGGEPASEGAGHLRTIKAAVKGSFPEFGVDDDSGVVTLTADEINALPAAISSGVDGINAAFLVDALFPVGSVYVTIVATNPGTLLGHGTWAARSQGRYLAGVGTGTDSASATKAQAAGDGGGTYEVTLSEDQMPVHSHRVYARSDGGDQARNYGLGGLGTALTGGTEGTQSYISVTGSAVKIIEDTGGTDPIDNTPPSFGVYIWERTA